MTDTHTAFSTAAKLSTVPTMVAIMFRRTAALCAAPSSSVCAQDVWERAFFESSEHAVQRQLCQEKVSVQRRRRPSTHSRAAAKHSAKTLI